MTSTTDTPERTRARRPGPIGVYLLMAVGLFAFQYGWHVAVGERPLVTRSPAAGTWVSGWVQFDASWYQDIVARGYWFDPGTPSNVAFFPLFPLAVRAVRALGVDPWIAGVLVAVAAGALVARWWDRWLVDVATATPEVRRTAWWLLLLFPFSFFLLGPAYADTLLLAATLAAFLLAERGRHVAAGLTAALATAARPTGIAVVVGIALLQWTRSGVLAIDSTGGGGLRRLRARIDRHAIGAATFAPLLGLIGIGAYSVYLWARFGDPVAYVTTQSAFHEGSRPLFDLNVVAAARRGWESATPATVAVGVAVLAAGTALAVWLGRSRPPLTRVAVVAVSLALVGVLGRWRDFTVDPAYRATITVQAFVCLGVALCIPAVHRRLGLAYSAYTATIVAAAVLTNGNFQSAGRYMLAAFPVALIAAERLATRPVARRVWFACSGTAMVLLAVAYSFVWFIA